MYDEINQDKFVRECEHYIEENVAAPYIAFYLAKGYSLDVLGTSSLKQHFNSAAEFSISILKILIKLSLI